MPNHEIEKPDREIRSFTIEFKTKKRQEGEEGLPMIEGYAAIFNSRSENLGGRYWEYYEVILPGAFVETIGQDDVVANFNHNSDLVLGRNTAETLSMREDDKGLFVEIDTPDTTYARDLVQSIERGDIKGMSFAFTITDSYWKVEDEIEVMYLEKVKLYDVSVVTHPAYRETSVGLRSLVCDHLKSVMGTSQERSERAQKALTEFQKEQERDVDGGDPLDTLASGNDEAAAGTVEEPSTPIETVIEGERALPSPPVVETEIPLEETRETETDLDWKVKVSNRKRKLQLLELSA